MPVGETKKMGQLLPRVKIFVVSPPEPSEICEEKWELFSLYCSCGCSSEVATAYSGKILDGRTFCRHKLDRGGGGGHFFLDWAVNIEICLCKESNPAIVNIEIFAGSVYAASLSKTKLQASFNSNQGLGNALLKGPTRCDYRRTSISGTKKSTDNLPA
jgi:hypothetical protein